MDYEQKQKEIIFKVRYNIVYIKFLLIGVMLFLVAWNQVFYVEDYVLLGIGSFFIAVTVLFGEKLV